MYRDGIRNFQLVEVLRRVDQPPVVHPHHHGAAAHVDGLHDADVAVVGTHALFPADALPRYLVVIAHLHHFVPHPEDPGRALQLRLALLWRVEQGLQLRVEGLGAGGAELRGAEHLNILHRIELVAAGQTGGHKVADQLLGCVAVGFEEEEIVRLSALFQRFARDDVVGILHDEALSGLPEYLVEADRRHQPGADDLAEDIARADAGQLVGVAYHNNTAAVPQGRNEGLEQLDVHHTHLVEDDDVALEQVLIVVDEADHAAGVVHFQQAVDGGGFPARQLAQTLGGAACGSTEGYPFGLVLQQLQDGVDRGGLAGAGAAGEDKAVLGHGLADGFLLERRIGKALRQFQDLDVLVEVSGRLLSAPGQHGQTVGDVLLCNQQIRQINIRCAVEHPHRQFPGLDAAVQRRRQLFGGLVDEVRRRFQQLRPGQTGVAVAGVVAQGAQEGGFQPLGAVSCHLVILGDAVGMAEVQLQRLPAEQVGVLLDGLHGPRPEGAEDFHRPAGADLELSQIGDELPHSEHPLELLLDAVGLVRRDARDEGELGGVVGDHFQRRRAEFVNDLIRRPCADVGQRPAGEEGVDGLEVFGHIRLALLCVELSAIGGVVLVPAPADDALTGVELSHHAAHNGDDTAARHLEHGVAVVLVQVDDVLYRAFQPFQLLLHRPASSF